LTSELKIKTNRTNSRASTGPRTPHGRARAARNALRHGLNLPVCCDSVLSQQVEVLAREIAGADANTEIQDSARLIAEAEIDLRRVREARHQLVTEALRNPYYDSRANMCAKIRLLSRLLRPNVPEVSLAALTNNLTLTPQGDDKLAVILSQEVKRLQAFDRYERRALSRRKLAIQAFDRVAVCKG
jgi:hypothetical protein